MLDFLQTDSRSAVQYSRINMKPPSRPMLAQNYHINLEVERPEMPGCRRCKPSQVFQAPGFLYTLPSPNDHWRMPCYHNVQCVLTKDVTCLCIQNV